MSKRYTYTTTLNWGGDTPTAEIEVTVSYSVSPGSPAQGPSYDSGGQPGESPMIEDITLDLVEGKPRPWDMGYGYITDDDFAADCVEKIEGSDRNLEDMLNEASEIEESCADEAREHQYESRREMARDDDW